MNDKPTNMENELERVISEQVRQTPAVRTQSVADQMRTLAELIRDIQREIDALYSEVGKRCDDLKRRLGTKS